MVLSILTQELKQLPDALRSKDKVLQDLEGAMRAKGDVTPSEAAVLGACRLLADSARILAVATGSLVTWFTIGSKRIGPPVPPPLLLRFGLSAGSALFGGNIIYYWTSHSCTEKIFELGEERMKMNLANIVLTKHSNDKTMLQAVKRHFFVEHLFSDLHQDRPVFRWHPRHSYMDSAFVERVKEIEANNLDNKATPISAHTTRSFGDLMEDPLACVLGCPGGDMEGSNLPEQTDTILKRREPRAHRRGHRHRRGHADKFAAL